jgi:class 3 adenylate cyclase
MPRVSDFSASGVVSAGDLMQQNLVSLLALGMALAFVSADRDSISSRWLALFFVGLGLSIDLNIVVGVQWNVSVEMHGWFALSEGMAGIAMLEWILLVRRTVPAQALDVRAGDYMLRLGQAASVLYCLLAVLYPDVRLRDFLGAVSHEHAFARPGFWLFAGPIMVVGYCGIASIMLLLNRRPDRPEKVRIVAMACAIPALVVSMVLPLHYNDVPLMLGEIVFLIGSVRYHVLQGQRGQFMSRFLSPQVARLVAERGLKTAMRENLLEITVVCCDLRGFSAYAEAQPSARVLQVLREYYDAVGAVVAEFGATIKDFAGDGILILVGAPIVQEQHARRGMEMAQRIRALGLPLTRQWSTPTHPLGIGLGVASGPVTVGVIGATSRLEYTAVGSAVNLASRLCEQAAHAEILLDCRTVEMAGDLSYTARLETRTPLLIRGFSREIAHYAACS